jgi:hypothetical protein
MSEPTFISQATVRAAAARIGDGDHCQAGGAIALSAALAAALAQATANSTLATVTAPTPAQTAAAHAMQTALAATRADFLTLADQDTNAILAFVALEARGEALAGYAALCDGPRAMAAAAMAAAQRMQDFRTHVGEQSRDDLEFAITLMAGVARAAMQLLDSNLRIWPLPDLLARYEPALALLLDGLATLHPRVRIRE